MNVYPIKSETIKYSSNKISVIDDNIRNVSTFSGEVFSLNNALCMAILLTLKYFCVEKEPDRKLKVFSANNKLISN